MRHLMYDREAARRLRISKGLRPADVAFGAKMSTAGLYNIERGSVPRATTLARLASALRVSIGDFFRHKEDGA